MEDQKKSNNRIKKEELVEKLVEKLKAAKSVVLADYTGLSVAAGQELKNALREAKAEFTVAKNTLFSLAAKKAGLDFPEEELKGPTSVVISYEDEISPIKQLSDFAKKYETLKVKLGFLDKDYLPAERVTALAQLPSKEVLRGKVVGGLYSPLYGLVGVLNGNLRNLVYVLNAVREQKEKGGAS